MKLTENNDSLSHDLMSPNEKILYHVLEAKGYSKSREMIMALHQNNIYEK